MGPRCEEGGSLPIINRRHRRELELVRREIGLPGVTSTEVEGKSWSREGEVEGPVWRCPVGLRREERAE